ncbi:MAG: hypothetical protein CML13_08785, partial [Puniceicoccaceae bacterium]|nr:hypothetical protein [Puniceicoccaceae bacterium]
AAVSTVVVTVADAAVIVADAAVIVADVAVIAAVVVATATSSQSVKQGQCGSSHYFQRGARR